MLRTHKGKKGNFKEKKIPFVTALDLVKSLKQINLQRVLHTWVPIS